MTGIIVDRYEDEVFVFADGRVTDGDFVLTDHDDKILKIDNGNIFTMCGDASIMDQCISYFEENRLDPENVKNLTGAGSFIWAHSEGVKIVDVDNDGTKENIPANGISSFKLKTLPMFFGSGSRALSGAYFALDCNKSKDKKEYLAKIKKCYKASSQYVSSMGPLKQVESIAIGVPRNG